jgi:HlyD family secretion protein
MKGKTFMIITILIVALVSIFIMNPFSEKESAVKFETVRVHKGIVANTVTATGRINATTTVKVGTQVSGILKGVFVDFNDAVKKGQLLAQLDETPLQAQLEQSQALLDQAQAQLNYNESTFNRMKVLYEQNLIPQSDYDQAVYNHENSKAVVANAMSDLARSRVNLDYATITSPIDGVILNRAVEEGQTVAASFNTPELFTIVNDLTQMEVKASVDEADIGNVNPGQRVEFSVDAYPDLKFSGKVSDVRLQPVITNNVVTYDVILTAPNAGKKLMPGMTASAIIYVEEKSDVLIMPAKAVRFDPDKEYLQKAMNERTKDAHQAAGSGTALKEPGSGMHQDKPLGDTEMQEGLAVRGAMQRPEIMKRVWVKNDRGGIQPVLVTTGIGNAMDVEIVSGLNEGDEVIISMTGGSKKAASARDKSAKGPFPGIGPQGG